MSENHRLEEALKAGIKIPEDGYWGNTPSKICGAYGGAEEGNIDKKTVESLEKKAVKSNK